MQIIPEKFYSLYEIAKDDIFETGRESFTDRKNKSRAIINADKFTNNRLKTMMVPDPEVKNRVKYAIRGSDIIVWLANNDDKSNR